MGWEGPGTGSRHPGRLLDEDAGHTQVVWPESRSPDVRPSSLSRGTAVRQKFPSKDPSVTLRDQTLGNRGDLIFTAVLARANSN